MSETNDCFELMRKQLSNNLKLLSTQEFIRRSKESVEINPDTFKRLSQKTFQLITYHLFHTLDVEECRKRFIGCYPVKDRKQEAEFRSISYKWLQDIAEKEMKFQFPRVLPIYFQHFTPEIIVCQLYLVFTNYVMNEEMKRMSSGDQHLGSVQLDSQIIFNEYQTIRTEIRKESEEYIQKLQYFIETYGKLCKSFDILLENKNRVLNLIRNKYSLSDDSDIEQTVTDHFSRLKNSITQIEIRLSQMNDLAETNNKSYSIIFCPQTNTSTELSIDLNKWFAKNSSKSFAAAAHKLILRFKTIDPIIQNVSADSLLQYSDNSFKFGKEIEKYEQKLEEINSQMISMFDRLECLRARDQKQLLSAPEIIERRKWFAERVIDISKFRFKLEVKPISNEKENTPEVVKKDSRESIAASDDSPVFRPRQSLLDYSFHVMDISTCQYIPPTSCPLTMNDSHLFSPVEENSDK